MLNRQLLAAAALAASAAAQTTTVNALLGSDLTASVVVAGCVSTIYAIDCVNNDSDYCAQVSQFGPATVTVTEGSTANELAFSTSTAGGIASMSASCDYYGPSPSFTSEECVFTFSVSISDQITSTSTTIGQASLITPNPLVLTAGIDKLTNSACPGVAATTTASSTTSEETSTTSSSSSSSKSSASTSKTSASQGVTAAATTATTAAASSATSGSTGAAAVATVAPIYKILVPVGAAIAAGAVFL